MTGKPELPDAGKTVACPGCGTQSLFGPSNPCRPFCCERCRLIDLGEWAAESYRVPVRADPGMPGAPEGEIES